MDALTKVLVSLYEEAEKPDDALEYPFRVYGFSFLHSTAFLQWIDWLAGKGIATRSTLSMLIFIVHGMYT